MCSCFSPSLELLRSALLCTETFFGLNYLELVFRHCCQTSAKNRSVQIDWSDERQLFPFAREEFYGASSQ